MKEQVKWDTFSHRNQQHFATGPVGGGGVVGNVNSCEASPNQRKSSRIASQLKTFLTAATGMSTEDETETHHQHDQVTIRLFQHVFVPTPFDAHFNVFVLRNKSAQQHKAVHKLLIMRF